MLDFQGRRYYLIQSEDGSHEVVFSSMKPPLGRKFNPFTGEFYGPTATAVTEIDEREVIEKYPESAVTAVSWFGFEAAPYIMVDGKPYTKSAAGNVPVLDKHSKLVAHNDLYDVWEPYAPYTVKLPNGATITENEREEVYQLILIDKKAGKCYQAELDVDDEPVKYLRAWLASHKV